MQQHIEQGVLLEKGCSKVLEVFQQAIISFRPVHGEVEAVFVALGGIGKITAIGAVGNHKKLQILEQGMFTVKTLFTVAVHLIKGFADRHAALFQFHLHQRQAIHQNSDIITIGMTTLLLKLLDDLNLIAGNVFFVYQVDVLDMTIVKHKIMDIVVVNFAGFIDDAVARLVQPGLHKPHPLSISELHVVQGLQLLAHVGQQLLRRI